MVRLYDPIGQLTDINSQTSLTGKDNKAQQHTRNHQYQYDAIGRLTQHKLAGQNTNIIEQFAFDPAGNRVSDRGSSIETNKQPQAAQYKSQGRPSELTSQGKRVRYTYDSDGRVSRKTITTNPNQSDNNLVQFKKEIAFSYNANNELSQTVLTHHKGSDTVVTTTHYYYDAFGRRIHKHSEINQGSNTHNQHTHMLWDGDKAIQEYTDAHVYNTIYDQGSFTPVARAVWLKENLQQAANEDSDNTVSNHDSKTIQVYHYHNDQLGTPNELTNKQGEVVWLADYEAWGNTARVVWNENQLDQLQVSQNELQPIRFQGQYYDEETGLHYNRFRYYDPDMGMFTSRDPIGLMGGSNVFAYAPNPTGWIDPLGLAPRTPSSILSVEEKRNQARPQKPNTTSTLDFVFSGKAVAGASFGLSTGKTADKDGNEYRCVVATTCTSVSPGGKATAGLGATETNAATAKGLSSVTQSCESLSAAKGLGAYGGVCKNSDRSTSKSAGVLIGAGADADAGVCQAISYCF